MKRLFLASMAACLMAATAWAGEECLSFSDRVTGGSLTINYTNSARPENVMKAYRLDRVTYAMPNAVTNALTITHIRRFVLPDLVFTNVFTNSVTDGDGGLPLVETNYTEYSAGSITFTNTYVMPEVTNSTAVQVYDLDDFGYSFMFEPYDTAIFSLSWTNDPVYMIRVYETYPRP